MPHRAAGVGPADGEPMLFIIGIVAFAVAIQVGLYFAFGTTRPRHQKEPRKNLPLSNWRS
jgi:hypothetical protein